MQKTFTLTQKRGFSANTPFKIYDEEGKLFYSSYFTDRIKNGKILYFNLPKGTYSIKGFINRLGSPVKQKEIKLPPKERNFPKRKMEIMFGENPSKCTVFWNGNVILFDNQFLKSPKYVLFDIYFHELGHRYYKTEHLADLYATKRMLDYGFNISQIGRSVIGSLSDKSHYRKEVKINSML